MAERAVERVFANREDRTVGETRRSSFLSFFTKAAANTFIFGGGRFSPSDLHYVPDNGRRPRLESCTHREDKWFDPDRRRPTRFPTSSRTATVIASISRRDNDDRDKWYREFGIARV